MAGLVSGGPGNGGLSSKDYWGLGIAGAGAVLPMLFGGSDNTKGPMDALNKNAQNATDLSTKLGAKGAELFDPAADYLKKVLGGDRQSLLEATQPERRRVIDQYATAKKSIAEFTPRGGGQASSLNALQASEAGDLANIGSTARQGAMQTGLSAGLNLEGLGLSASSVASNDYAAILSAIQQQNSQKGQSAAALGQSIGMIAAMAFL